VSLLLTSRLAVGVFERFAEIRVKLLLVDGVDTLE